MIPPLLLPNKNRFALAAASVLLCGGALHAAVLVDYDFNNPTGAPIVSPTNASVNNVFAGNPGTDPGVTIQSNANNVAYTPKITIGTPNTSNDSSAALAFTSNYYVEFTLTPSAGFSVSLDSLTFDIGGSSAGSQQFNANFYVRSNLVGTGFDTNVGSVQTILVPGGSAGANTPGTATIDLSSLSAFQNVESPVTFRVYAYTSDETIVTKNNRPRLNDLVLNGSVDAVPEPGTVALATIALVGFTIFGRKVRKNSR